MVTQLQQMLIDKYAPNGAKSKGDEMILLSVGMGAKEFGFEDEVINYLQENPNATVQDLGAFAERFFPEIIEKDT